MRPTVREVVEQVVALVVAVGGTVAVTWPLAEPGWFGTTWDALYAVMSVEQLQEALTWGTPLYDGPLMHPLPDSLTFADVVIGQAVLGMPLRWLDIEPLYSHNLLVLLGIAWTAWALILAARLLTGRGPHTWVAAIGAWAPVHLVHLQHLNLLHHQFGVLAAVGLGWGLHRRSAVATGLGSLAVGLGFFFGAYVGVHGGVMAAGVLLAAALARAGDRRSWGAALGGLLLSAVVVWPLVAAYGETAARYALWTDPEELRKEVWDLAQTLAPARQVWAHRALGAVNSPVDPINPTYAVFALSLLGLVGLGKPSRERWLGWAVVLVAGIAGLLALGPELMVGGESTGVPAPYALLEDLPGFRGLRAPARWFAVSAMAMALGAAAGAKWLGQKRWWWLAAALLLSCVELPRHNPLSAAVASLEVPEVYRTLDKVPGRQAVFDEALLVRSDNRCGHLCGLRAVLYHQRPVLGGAAARWFDEISDIARLARTWPDGTALELFQALDVRLVVDHMPFAELPARADWVQCRQADGVARVCELDLPRRAPLPPPEAVTTEPNGPVVGLRWPRDVVALSTVDVRCDGAPAGSYRVQVYKAVSGLRHGPTAPLEVFLASPCEGTVASSLEGQTELYRRPGFEDAVWRAELAPRSRAVSDAAGDLPHPQFRR